MGRVDTQGTAAFDAFLSYSRRDAHEAERLRSAIERFARPWYRPRTARVFLDTAVMSAGGPLRATIERSLASAVASALMVPASTRRVCVRRLRCSPTTSSLGTPRRRLDAHTPRNGDVSEPPANMGSPEPGTGDHSRAKNVAMSRASSSGCSVAAKCPPDGIGVHRTTRYIRSAHSRGGGGSGTW